MQQRKLNRKLKNGLCQVKNNFFLFHIKNMMKRTYEKEVEQFLFKRKPFTLHRTKMKFVLDDIKNPEKGLLTPIPIQTSFFSFLNFF